MNSYKTNQKLLKVANASIGMPLNEETFPHIDLIPSKSCVRNFELLCHPWIKLVNDWCAVHLNCASATTACTPFAIHSTIAFLLFGHVNLDYVMSCAKVFY